MPIYSYKCNECGEEFDSLRSISSRDEKKECPKCGTLDTERKVDTTTATFKLKGEGFYARNA